MNAGDVLLKQKLEPYGRAARVGFDVLAIIELVRPMISLTYAASFPLPPG